APSDPVAFAASVRSLLGTTTLAGTRLLWLQSPDAPFDAWSYVAVGAPPPAATGAVIPGVTVFGFRNYALVLDGGGVLTSTATGLSLQPPAVPGAVRIPVDDGRAAPVAGDGAVAIPLVGPQAGCLCFHVAVPSGPSGTAPIDALDVGCRFYVDDAGWPGM